jgi:hypothetical protein
VGREKVRVAAQAPHVHVDLPDRLGPVQHDEDARVALLAPGNDQLLDGQHQAQHRGLVGDRQHAGPGRDRRAETRHDLRGIVGRDRDRHALPHGAVALRALLEAAAAAGMLLVGLDDLVAALEVQAVRNQVHADGRVLGQGQLVHVATDEARQRRTHVLEGSIPREPLRGFRLVVPVREGLL